MGKKWRKQNLWLVIYLSVSGKMNEWEDNRRVDSLAIRQKKSFNDSYNRGINHTLENPFPKWLNKDIHNYGKQYHKTFKTIVSTHLAFFIFYITCEICLWGKILWNNCRKDYILTKNLFKCSNIYIERSIGLQLKMRDFSCLSSFLLDLENNLGF